MWNSCGESAPSNVRSSRLCSPYTEELFVSSRWGRLSSRPWDKRGSPKKIFWPFGPQFGIKVRWEGWVPLDPPLVLIITVHDSEWPDARKRGRNNSPRGDAAHVSQLKRSSTDNRRDRRHHHYHSTAAACGYGRPGLNWLIQTYKVGQVVFSWNRIFTQILVLLPKCDDRTLD